MSDETKVDGTATPAATATSEVVNGETTHTTQVADPVITQAQTNGTEKQTAKATATTDTPKDELPKGVKRELYELRKARREDAERIKALEEKITSNVHTTAQVEPVIPPSLLDDPDKWAQSVVARAKTEAKTEIIAEQQATAENKRIEIEGKEALDYILTQSELTQNEDYVTTIEEILRNPDIAYISQKYPKRAAEIAISVYKANKGINASRQEQAKANSTATATTTASVNPVGGKKIWKAAEAEKYIGDFNSPGFDKRNAEIQEAASEGRIK